MMRTLHLPPTAALAAALALTLAAGCASSPSGPSSGTSDPSRAAPHGDPGAPAAALPVTSAAVDDALFQDLGGHAGVAALIESLIREIAADDDLRPRFRDVNITRFQRTLEEQLCAESGGGCTYTGDDMRRAHANLDITRAEFNAVVEALARAMDAQDLPVAVQNRVLALHAPKRDDVLGE